MAIMESTDFSFAGVYSSTYGIYNITMNNGMHEEAFLSKRSILETPVKGNPKPYFNDIKYEPLTFKLSFAFTNTWDDNLIRTVARWLNQSYYQPLFFAEHIDRIFYCMPVDDLGLIHNGLQQGYVTLNMRCDSPFSYNAVNVDPLIDLTTNPVGGTTITFNNQGDVDCHPELWITKIGNGGDVRIVNQTNAGQEFKFSSPIASGTLNFSGDVADTETITIGRDTYEFDNGNGVVAGNIAVNLFVPDPTTAPTLAIINDSNSTLPTGTYYVKYTWSNAFGETKVSPIASITTLAGQKINITLPSFPLGATFGNVYIGTVSGSETFQSTLFSSIYVAFKPIVSGRALPTSNTTTNYTYSNAISSLTSVINTSTSKLESVTAISSATSILVNSINSTPMNISSHCVNGYWLGTQLTSAGLNDGEIIYVDNEREYIESSVANTYRYNIFNNQYLDMVVGINTLQVYGTVQLQFRYQFKTLA